MALKDLRKTLGDGHKLPINGKTYLVPFASAEAGLRFQNITAVMGRVAKAKDDDAEYEPTDDDAEILSDAQEIELARDVLGEDLYDEMKADGCVFAEVRIAAYYALFYAVFGEDRANAFWNSGGKAPAANRKARRTATRTRTAAANTTRTRG